MAYFTEAKPIEKMSEILPAKLIVRNQNLKSYTLQTFFRVL